MPVDTPDEQHIKSKRDTQNRHIIQSTALLVVLFTVTKLISLAQTFIIARFFGLGGEWDAYVSANRVPEQIVTLISGGALGHAFIPIFSSYLARGERDDGYRLASQVMNTVLAVALLLSGIAFVFTPWIMANWIAPGFVENPQTFQQSVVMMRILLLGAVIFSISGLFSAILHSNNHFLLPAIAPIMYDLGILFGVVFLLNYFGVYGVAIGTVLGALAHLLIQVPGLIRYGARWFPEFGFRNPTLWRVVRLMLPRVIGLFVFQFNFLVMGNIASQLGRDGLSVLGGISAINWGWRLMQIPQTLIGTAMGIVIFPTLAALSELQDKEGKRNAMSDALKFVIILSIPATVGLLLIGRPLLSLLEGGAFKAEDSLLVYSTLSAFTLGLLVHSMLEIIARSFYADKDTWTPLWAALIGAATSLGLSIWWSGILSNPHPPVENVMWLALASSLGFALEVAILTLILRHRWQGINEKAIITATVKTLIASLVMGIGVFVVGQIFSNVGLQGRLLYTVVQLAVQVTVGAIVFYIMSLLLGIHEIKSILQKLFQMVRRRSSPQHT